MAARGSQRQTIPADVVVVGGGMVGGALALALATGGLAVALVDRTPLSAMAAAPYDGRASAIAYASQRLLAQIGLWREIEHTAEPILDIRVSGRRVVAVSALRPSGSRRDAGRRPLRLDCRKRRDPPRPGGDARSRARCAGPVAGPGRAPDGRRSARRTGAGRRHGSGRTADRRRRRHRFAPARPGPHCRRAVALSAGRHRLHHGP